MLILYHHVIHVSIYTWLYRFIITFHLFLIHDSHAVHMHAIGVPKGVTLLEFEQGLPEEQ